MIGGDSRKRPYRRHAAHRAAAPELGESVERIQPDLIIPTGKRKGQNPSVASIYRALAEHAKREAYPEAVEQAHADVATLTSSEVPEPRTGAEALTTR
ncbi:hypothetical protein ABZ379_31240 [Streptomyces canus]|uniref:hypothetical protein n=1 Tax=Streptomyces canus TaxID=58343 RepID=UPI0033E884F5